MIIDNTQSNSVSMLVESPKIINQPSFLSYICDASIIFIYMYLTTYYFPSHYIHTYEIILDWSTVYDHYCLHDHCCCYGLFHVFALTQPLVSPQARIEHLHQDLRDVLMEEAHRTWNTWNMHRTEKTCRFVFSPKQCAVRGS